MSHSVTIVNTGEMFRCSQEMNLLAAAERALCREIPVGCRNGGCGVCKVHITVGSYQTQKMNRAVLSVAEETDGFALACKTYPLSDMEIHVMRLGPVKKFPQRSFSFEPAWTTSIPQPEPNKEK